MAPFCAWFRKRRRPTFRAACSSSAAITASDDVTLLYYDVRGVSRVYAATLSGRILKFWRNAPGPGLAQRFTATFADDGSTIQFVSELSEDGTTWLNDLEQTYTRVR